MILAIEKKYLGYLYLYFVNWIELNYNLLYYTNNFKAF